jgi:hypothetical protein
MGNGHSPSGSMNKTSNIVKPSRCASQKPIKNVATGSLRGVNGGGGSTGPILNNTGASGSFK